MTSADGTVIGYTRHGDGPRVILVGGGLDDGTENAPLAEALANHRAQLIRSQHREKARSASDGGGSPRNSILVDMLRR